MEATRRIKFSRSGSANLLSGWIKCSDADDPMVEDMAIGSDFLEEINTKDLPDLTGGNSEKRGQYLSIASNRVDCILACFGQWEASEADGPVSVASASLLEKGVPLVVDNSYSHSGNQGDSGQEVANVITRYFANLRLVSRGRTSASR